MGKWLSKFQELKPIRESMEDINLKLKYNGLLKRERAGEICLDDPSRTDAEYEKWLPGFQGILTSLNELISNIGLENCTEEERMNGFDIIPLLGTEVSLDVLPEKWKEG